MRSKSKAPEQQEEPTGKQLAIVIPPTAEVGSTEAWPVMLRFPSVAEAIEFLALAKAGRDAASGRHTGAPSSDVIVADLMSRMASAFEAMAQGAGKPNSEAHGSGDDDFITQDDERLPDRELYLRLARQKAFPSKKHGKKIIARWGDVKAALLGPSQPKLPSLAKGTQGNGLDDARRALGLKTKGA